MKKYLKYLLISILLSFVFVGFSVAECVLKEGYLLDYEGDVGGKYPIHLTLTRKGNVIHGVYFYVSQLKDIKLTGTMISTSEILIKEYDKFGKNTGLFKGNFLTADPKGKFKSEGLLCEVLVGTWGRTKEASKQLSFYLSATGRVRASLENRYAKTGAISSAQINKNAYDFWMAVKKRKKIQVAKYIKFPLLVNINQVSQVIENESDFIDYYDLIIPEAKRIEIIRSIPHNMFSNINGIMLGKGVVWFDHQGKIKKL